MPYNLHIVKTSDFIRLNAKGETDVKHSHDVLAGLAEACFRHGVTCALLDVRDMKKNSLKLTDLHTLAMAFREMGFREKHKLAVLHRLDGGERAELFAMFASDRGWNVQAFGNYEEAVDWFSAALPIEKLNGGEK
jgi:hypothetical protein